MSKRKHAEAQGTGFDGKVREKKPKREKKTTEIDGFEQQQSGQAGSEIEKQTTTGRDNGEEERVGGSIEKKKRKKKKAPKRHPDTEPTFEEEITLGKLTTTFAEKGSAWILSEPIGGRLMDIDPVFSVDEQYLLLAYESSIGVYAVSTSLLIRSISTTSGGHITACGILPHQPSHLQFSTSTGMVEQWDWTSGKRVGRWDIKSHITSLETGGSTSTEASVDVAYTIDFDEKWMITAHRFKNGTKAELHTLLKRSDQITHLKVLAAGRLVVASAGQRLLLGNTDEPCPSDLKSIVYTWREIECSESISSLDVRITHNANDTKDVSTIKAPRQMQSLSLAVGGSKGAIYVYHDILEKLVRKEKNAKLPAPTPQRLHWHRNEVMAMKWSADGNYIISGGVETVLVLWQLDTGQKQHLPHLSATIESIVVSPTGSSYAVRLANNSAMIISTAELQSKFSISGIQIPMTRELTKGSQHSAYLTTTSRREALNSLRLPLTASSSGSDRLLLAVPASSSRNSFRESTNAAFLQTLHVSSGSQIAKQALTRNSITSLNMSPNSRPIEGPNVTLVKISNDGQWLATIDEWMPPREDVASMSKDENITHEVQRNRLEVFLKFWAWNDERKIWELVSRIDNPHGSSGDFSKSGGSILDLVAEPSSPGFGTVGHVLDRIVKVWKPHIRYRNGLVVQAKDGTSLASWSCRRVIKIPDSNTVDDRIIDHQTQAALAFSVDGSLLVLGYQTQSESLIHVIDVQNSRISYSLPNLVYGSLKGVGIIDRYLMILSNGLIIWDLVDDQIHYAYSLVTRPDNGKQRLLMAVDQRSGTFAVVMPKESKKRSGKDKWKMELAVFDPAHPKPLFTETLPRSLVGLVPASQHRGFLAITTAAELRTLSPSSHFDHDADILPKSVKPTTAGLDILFVNDTRVVVPSATKIDGPIPMRKMVAPVVESSENVPLVRQHQIAAIFDTGPSFALPSMSNLFERVARVFSKT